MCLDKGGHYIAAQIARTKKIAADLAAADFAKALKSAKAAEQSKLAIIALIKAAEHAAKAARLAEDLAIQES